MAHRISGIVPLLFITLLCVGLVEGGYLALEYFLTKKPPGRESVLQQSAVKAVQKPEVIEQQHDFRVIFKRNLFGSAPTADKVEVVMNEIPADLQITSLEIVLKGTIDGKKGNKRAIILDKKNKTQDLYQKGDSIQGAFVKEILRGKVILTYNGQDEVVEMSETAGKAEPPRPVAVAPGTVQKNVIPGARPAVQKRPARRVVKPRVIRPPKQAEET